MNNTVYAVVRGEDNYGVASFELFDSEEKATAHAKVLMARYDSGLFPWVYEAIGFTASSWRAGCDYITVFIKEVS